MAKDCPDCRIVYEDYAKFCTKCGYRFATNPKANVPSKNKFGLVVLGLVGVAIVINLLLSVFGNNTGTVGDLNNTRTPTQFADIGETFTMKKPTVCGDTKEGFDEIVKWLALNDNQEAGRAMLKYGGSFINAGDKVKVLDTAFTVVKVRILKSDHECWTVREATER
jgi:hypothetical protein